MNSTHTIKVGWDKLAERFEDETPQEILEFALTELPHYGDLVFLTGFGPEGCVIMDMIAQMNLLPNRSDQPSSETKLREKYNASDFKFTIANLDTGYQFKETLELKEQLEEKYSFRIDMVHPRLSIEMQDHKHGKDLYKTDPDKCCYMRKILPLERLLEDKFAWLTAIRRDQTKYREEAKTFELDEKFRIGKINPLVKWTKSDVWKYIHENKVPYNALLDKGYDSIGCEPCTRSGEGRSGRWAGKDKIECGIHLPKV